MSQDIKNIIREIAQEIIDEMTGTGAVAGYQTPFAFSGKGDSDKKKKLAARSMPGGKVVGEEVTDDVEVDNALPTIRRGLNESDQKTDSAAMQNGMRPGMTEKEILVQGYDNLFAINMKITNGDKHRAKVRTRNRMWYMDNGDYADDVLHDYKQKFGEIKYSSPVGKNAIEEGRYNNFKKDESMKSHTKVCYGLREANKMLREIEFLVSICERLKSETGVDQRQMWKATAGHLSEINKRTKAIARRVIRIGKS